MSDQSRSAPDGPLAAARSPAGLADAVRDQASGYVERRKGDAAGFISDLAEALRGGGGHLDEAAQVRSLFHTVADSLDDLAAHVNRRGPADLFRDVEAAARRNPMTAVALAAAAGYGAFHVLRSKGAGIR